MERQQLPQMGNVGSELAISAEEPFLDECGTAATAQYERARVMI